MDIYFGVFNCQKPDLDKARRAYNKRFGTYKQDIAPYVRKGIMSIFEDPPTDKTRFYVEALAGAVNKRIGEDQPAQTQP